MSDASDWEPLSPEQLAGHPGELLAAPRPPAAKPAPPGPVPRAEAPPAPAPDPAAQQALLQLQARLAKAPASQSLIGRVQRREQQREHRQQQQQRAAQAPALQACRPVQSTVQVKDLPLEVEYDLGQNGRDPREDEAWFLALPAAERERLHAVWAQKREQVAAHLPVQRRNQNRRTAGALLVFTAVLLAGTSAQWIATLGAGVVCGIAWRHVSPCRYRDPMIAFGCLLVAHIVAWVASGTEAMPSGLFMDGVLLVAFAALVGFDGEIRRTGGFDAK